jgi:hypothetical protein
MGSLVANTLMTNYPDAVNGSILTGFSKTWVNVIPGFAVTAGLKPAALVDPQRFGNLGATYLAATYAPGVQYLLFYTSSGGKQYFDPALSKADYDARGTITVGEAISGALPTIANKFKGSVYVMTGQQDVVFCGKLGLQTDPPSDCLQSNILEETRSLYPNAANYSVGNSTFLENFLRITNVAIIVVCGA